LVRFWHAILQKRRLAFREVSTKTRSHRSARYTLLVDLAVDGVVVELAAQAGRIRSDLAARVPEYTGTLSVKGRRVAHGAWADRWGCAEVAELGLELRRRGLGELRGLATMLVLLEMLERR
jgi:hypothetical protein